MLFACPSVFIAIKNQAGPDPFLVPPPVQLVLQGLVLNSLGSV